MPLPDAPLERPLRIGELARSAGVSRKAVRYYEAHGLIKARRSPAGYREFDRRTIELVRAIRSAKRMGIRLEDLRDVVEHISAGTRPCADLRRLIGQRRTDIARRIDELRAFDDFLAEVETVDAADGACPILVRVEAVAPQ